MVDFLDPPNPPGSAVQKLGLQRRGILDDEERKGFEFRELLRELESWANTHLHEGAARPIEATLGWEGQIVRGSTMQINLDDKGLPFGDIRPMTGLGMWDAIGCLYPGMGMATLSWYFYSALTEDVSFYVSWIGSGNHFESVAQVTTDVAQGHISFPMPYPTVDSLGEQVFLRLAVYTLTESNFNADIRLHLSGVEVTERVVFEQSVAS